MTTVRDRLEAALDGRTPDKTPLSIYAWMLGDPANFSPEAQRLLDMGLGLTVHTGTVQAVEHGTETTHEEKKEGPYTYSITQKKTPVGELRYVRKNGWHHESWIKHPGDYRVWQWIVEHTELKASYGGYSTAERLAGDRGVVVVTVGRTPAMDINIDVAGTERFCMDVASEVTELFDLYEALRKLHRRKIEIVAAGPGRFVAWFENLTVSMLGPKRYADLLLPIYNECVPMLEQAGKRAMVHYDGRLSCIRDLIAAAPFHAIESLTEPPEGDMTYDECRAAWPDKAFWANISLHHYYEPADKLRQAVVEKRTRAGKRGLAFEISEDIPRNWPESIPVVLDTLEELD